MIINLLNYLKSLIIKMQVIYVVVSMQIWDVTSWISTEVVGTTDLRIICSVWLCILCHLHFSIISPIWLLTLNLCAIHNDVIDRLPLARTPSDAWSLSLGPGLCLDWRRTKGLVQGIRPARAVVDSSFCEYERGGGSRGDQSCRERQKRIWNVSNGKVY